MVKNNINKITIGAVIGLLVLFAGYVFLSSFSFTGNAVDAVDKNFNGMHIGEKIKVSNKLVSLDNVGSTGAIIVAVDGTRDTISNGKTKNVNCLPITNERYKYFDNKAKRMALINIGDDRSSCFEQPANETNVTIPQCTDSDGGNTPSIKGTVILTGNFPGNETFTDICISSNQLMENYCLSGGGRIGYNYYCQDGCQDGACRELKLQQPRIEKCNTVMVNGFISSNALQPPYWNWGDGTKKLDYQWFEATHTYNKNGKYSISATGIFGSVNITRTVNVTVGCFPN